MTPIPFLAQMHAQGKNSMPFHHHSNGLWHKNQADIIETLNSALSYLHGLLNINICNSCSEQTFDSVYPIKLQLNKSYISSDTEAWFWIIKMVICSNFMTNMMIFIITLLVSLF